MNGYFYDVMTIFKREMKHFIKNKASIFMGVTQPLLWFLLLGFGMNGFIGQMGDSQSLMATKDYITFIMPGIMAMTAMTGGLFGGAGIVNDINSGYVNKLLSAPISRKSIICGKILFSIVQTMLQILIIFALSLVFGVRYTLSIKILGIIVLLFLFSGLMSAIGTIVATKFKSHQAVYSFLGTLNIPLLFTSNAFFPRETMPVIMKGISWINPLSYVIDGERALLLMTKGNVLIDFIVLLVETIVIYKLSVSIFIKEYDRQ